MSWRERIELLEESFEAQKPLHKVMITLSIIFSIIGVGYYFLLEPLEQEIYERQMSLAALEDEIEQKSIKALEKKIKKLKRTILESQEEIERLKAQEMALLTKLKEQDYLFFNAWSFSKLLDDMLADSYSKGIELTLVTIEDRQKEFLGRLYERKLVHIEGMAPFLKIVPFVRGVEAHNMLLKVDNLLIETNGTMPRFTFEVKFYGAKL